MKTKLLVAGALAGTMLVSSGAVLVGAQQNNQNPNPTAQNQTVPNRGEWMKQHIDPAKLAEMEAKRAALDKAIESGYDAWKKFMEENPLPNGQKDSNPLLEKITADNFARFAEMHQLRKEAEEKMKQADAIGDELGLPRPHPGMGGPHEGFGPGKGFRHGPGMPGMQQIPQEPATGSENLPQ